MRTVEDKGWRRKPEQQEEEKRTGERRDGCRQLLQIKLDRFLIELSPLIEPTLLPLLFLFFCPSAECLSPGQPTYHYGNPLNHSEMHKKQSFHWWQASYHIRATYLNSKSAFCFHCTAICRSHYTHTHMHTCMRSSVQHAKLCLRKRLNF